VAGRYRALLIGNSTYPADEHNLQPLRGPVKDIAVLNRALADPVTGLFADVDVTLLPEATSTRAVRALGAFFRTADRDDVLLMYFSGHGKLDQMGRLHLCMNDTETTDLLSTAVSSARINEFAEASRARNVVIILDCCYAGAFRGGDLGAAVAGPGRYIITSCRGTQLANDATIDNGTSFFTQHVVEALLHAPDQDGDGYVSFSDLYTYVDRCLREDGKQIPQRRVDGDGDLHLAKRPPAAPVAGDDGSAGQGRASSAAPETGAQPTAVRNAVTPLPQAAVPQAEPGWTRRRVAIFTLGAGLTAVTVVTAGLLLRTSGVIGDHAIPGSGSHVATGPWRLRFDGTPPGTGCTITLTDTTSKTTVPLPTPNGLLYHVAQYQVSQAGSFQWRTNDRRCLVTAFDGSGNARLPFLHQLDGNTDAFPAPAKGVVVRIHGPDGNSGGKCDLSLFDAANGQELDLQQWSPGMGSVTLDPHGRAYVFVGDDNCIIDVSAQT
jgi:hypothetical protein